MTEAIIHFSEPLKAALERKKQRNSRYSMAALARDMDLSTPYLSRVFSGQKVPSSKLLRKAHELLDLTTEEQEALYISICFESLPTSKCQQFFLKLAKNSQGMGPRSDFLILEDDAYAILTKWQMMAILQLSSLVDFQSDPSWIAERLNTALSEVLESLAILFHHEFLTEENGKYVSTHKRILFNSPHANNKFTNYQKQMIQRQLFDLENFPEGVKQRFISGLTVATTPEKAKALEDHINKIIKDSFELLKTDSPTEIYQLNVGVTPLSGRNKK